MKRFCNYIGRTTALLAALGVFAAANAQTGTINNLQLSSNYGWAWNYVDGGEGGPFTGTYTNNSTHATTGSFNMYCISVTAEFWLGATFGVNPCVKDTEAGWLVDNVTPTNPTQATALQLAIWSLVPTAGYSSADVLSDYNNDGGASGSFAATYSDYLADLAAASGKKGEAYYFNLPNGEGDAQPQIAAYGTPGSPNRSIATTPGPAAFIPFGLGLFGLIRRKRA